MTLSKNRSWILRSIALSVAFVFMVTSVTIGPSSGYAFFENLNPSIQARSQNTLHSFLYAIPESVGSVADLWEPSAERSDNTFVIHIQDAHANPQAQQNISKLLTLLRQQYPDLVIGVEGAAGALHPEYFDFFPQFPEANQAILQDLSQKGELSGTESFLWNIYQGQTENPKIPQGEDVEKVRSPASDDSIRGVEDLELYRDNLRTYRELLFQRGEIQTALIPVRAEIEKKGSKVLNPELRDFLKERSRRKEGKYGTSRLNSDPNFRVYLAYLQKQTEKLLKIDLRDSIEQLRFPNLVRVVLADELRTELDLAQAGKEWQGFASLLEQKAETKAEKEFAEAFKAYAMGKQLIPVDEKMITRGYGMDGALYPRKLFEQLHLFVKKHHLSFEGKKQLIKSFAFFVFQAEIEIAGLLTEMDTLEAGIIDKLARTKEEKEFIKQLQNLDLLEKSLYLELTRPEYDQILSDLAPFHALVYPSKPLTSFFSKAQKFYTEAIQRDRALTRNLIALTKKSKGSERSLAVLITGGFHTGGIETLLRDQRIGHAVIMPHMDQTDRGERYEKVMSDANADLTSYFKVRNPFLTKQEALFFKEVLEIAAPVLFDRYQKGPQEVAETVSKSIENHPVLSQVLKVQADPQSASRLEMTPKPDLQALIPGHAAIPSPLSSSDVTFTRSLALSELPKGPIHSVKVSFEAEQFLSLKIKPVIATSGVTTFEEHGVSFQYGSLERPESRTPGQKSASEIAEAFKDLVYLTENGRKVHLSDIFNAREQLPIRRDIEGVLAALEDGKTTIAGKIAFTSVGGWILESRVKLGKFETLGIFIDELREIGLFDHVQAGALKDQLEQARQKMLAETQPIAVPNDAHVSAKRPEAKARSFSVKFEADATNLALRFQIGRLRGTTNLDNHYPVHRVLATRLRDEGNLPAKTPEAILAEVGNDGLPASIKAAMGAKAILIPQSVKTQKDYATWQTIRLDLEGSSITDQQASVGSIAQQLQKAVDIFQDSENDFRDESVRQSLERASSDLLRPESRQRIETPGKLLNAKPVIGKVLLLSKKQRASFRWDIPLDQWDEAVKMSDDFISQLTEAYSQGVEEKAKKSVEKAQRREKNKTTMSAEEFAEFEKKEKEEQEEAKKYPEKILGLIPSIFPELEAAIFKKFLTSQWGLIQTQNNPAETTVTETSFREHPLSRLLLAVEQYRESLLSALMADYEKWLPEKIRQLEETLIEKLNTQPQQEETLNAKIQDLKKSIGDLVAQKRIESSEESEELQRLKQEVKGLEQKIEGLRNDILYLKEEIRQLKNLNAQTLALLAYEEFFSLVSDLVHITYFEVTKRDQTIDLAERVKTLASGEQKFYEEQEKALGATQKKAEFIEKKQADLNAKKTKAVQTVAKLENLEQDNTLDATKKTQLILEIVELVFGDAKKALADLKAAGKDAPQSMVEDLAKKEVVLTKSLGSLEGIKQAIARFQNQIRDYETEIAEWQKFIDENGNAASIKKDQSLAFGKSFMLEMDVPNRVDRAVELSAGDWGLRTKRSALRIFYEKVILDILASRGTTGEDKLYRGHQKFENTTDVPATFKPIIQKVIDQLMQREISEEAVEVTGASYILVIPPGSTDADVAHELDRYGNQIKAIVGLDALEQTHWVVLARSRDYAPSIMLIPSKQFSESQALQTGNTAMILPAQEIRQGKLIINPNQQDLLEETKKARDYRFLTKAQKRLEHLPRAVSVSQNEDMMNPSSSAEPFGLGRTDIIPPAMMEAYGVLGQNIGSKDWSPQEWIDKLLSLGSEGLELKTNEEILKLAVDEEPVGPGTGRAIDTAFNQMVTAYGAVMAQPVLAGKESPVRTLDLQRDSKNKAFLELVESLIQKYPGSGLLRDAKKQIMGFDFYENSALGEFILTLQLAAMLAAYTKYVLPLPEEQRTQLVPLFPLIAQYSQFEKIKSKIWPAAQKIALWSMTRQSLSAKEWKAAEEKVREAAATVKFGIMVEYVSLLKGKELEMFMTDPEIVRFNVGNNDLNKDFWEVKVRAPMDRERAENALFFDQLHPELLSGMENLLILAKRYGKKVCFCGGSAEDPKFLAMVDNWHRRGLPVSVSVAREGILNVNHALQVFQNVPDEEQSSVALMAEEEDLLNIRAANYVRRHLGKSETVLILLEEWQERYQNAGYHHSLYRLGIDPKNNIGGFEEFIFLKKMIQALLDNDLYRHKLEAMELSKGDIPNAEDMEKILSYLVEEKLIFSEEKESLLKAFEFIERVQVLFAELQQSNPKEFSTNLYPGNLTAFLKAYEAKYGRPKWLSAQKEDLWLQEFYKEYYQHASGVFEAVGHTIHEYYARMFPPTYSGMKVLKTYRKTDGEERSIKLQVRHGLSFRFEHGFTEESKMYLHVEDAEDYFREHPEAMFEVFVLAAKENVLISHRTRRAMKKIQLELAMAPKKMQRETTKALQKSFNGSFLELLKMDSDISYPVWRMQQFHSLGRYFPYFDILKDYYYADGSRFSLQMQTLRSLEAMEKLFENGQTASYQRAASAFREVRKDPSQIMVLRLAVFLNEIIPIMSKGSFSWESVEKNVAEVLERLGIDDEKVTQQISWLVYHQHNLALNSFLSQEEIKIALQDVLKSPGFSPELFRLLYVMGFSIRVAEANPESQIMLPRRGAESPLAHLDQFYEAGKILTPKRNPIPGTEMIELGSEDLDRAITKADQIVSWGGKEEIWESLEQFVQTGEWLNVMRDYLAHTNGGSDPRLKEILVGLGEDPKLLRHLLDDYNTRTSVYYMRTLDNASLLKHLFFYRHLLYLNETKDYETIATAFFPLPHHYNQAFEVVLGAAEDWPEQLPLFSRVLYENQFFIEHGAMRNPPSAPPIYRFLGSFPKEADNFEDTETQIKTQLSRIFQIPKGLSKVLFKRGETVRFEQADALYGPIRIDKKDAWTGSKTQAAFSDEDEEFHESPASFLTINFSSDWRGQFLTVSTLLRRVFGLRIMDFKFVNIKGSPSRAYIYASKKGKALTADEKRKIENYLVEKLDLKAISISGTKVTSEVPEVVIRKFKVNPLARLHGRPASDIIKLIRGYDLAIEHATLIVNGLSYNMKSINNLLGAGVTGGMEVTVNLEGTDRGKLEAAMDALEEKVFAYAEGDRAIPLFRRAESRQVPTFRDSMYPVMTSFSFASPAAVSGAYAAEKIRHRPEARHLRESEKLFFEYIQRRTTYPIALSILNGLSAQIATQPNLEGVLQMAETTSSREIRQNLARILYHFFMKNRALANNESNFIRIVNLLGADVAIQGEIGMALLLMMRENEALLDGEHYQMILNKLKALQDLGAVSEQFVSIVIAIEQLLESKEIYAGQRPESREPVSLKKQTSEWIPFAEIDTITLGVADTEDGKNEPAPVLRLIKRDPNLYLLQEKHGEEWGPALEIRKGGKDVFRIGRGKKTDERGVSNDYAVNPNNHTLSRFHLIIRTDFSGTREPRFQFEDISQRGTIIARNEVKPIALALRNIEWDEQRALDGRQNEMIQATGDEVIVEAGTDQYRLKWIRGTEGFGELYFQRFSQGEELPLGKLYSDSNEEQVFTFGRINFFHGNRQDETLAAMHFMVQVRENADKQPVFEITDKSFLDRDPKTKKGITVKGQNLKSVPVPPEEVVEEETTPTPTPSSATGGDRTMELAFRAEDKTGTQGLEGEETAELPKPVNIKVPFVSVSTDLLIQRNPDFYNPYFDGKVQTSDGKVLRPLEEILKALKSVVERRLNSKQREQLRKLTAEKPWILGNEAVSAFIMHITHMLYESHYAERQEETGLRDYVEGYLREVLDYESNPTPEKLAALQEKYLPYAQREILRARPYSKIATLWQKKPGKVAVEGEGHTLGNLVISREAFKISSWRWDPLHQRRLPGEYVLFGTWGGHVFLFYTARSHRIEGTPMRLWRQAEFYLSIASERLFMKQSPENLDDIPPELARELDHVIDNARVQVMNSTEGFQDELSRYGLVNFTESKELESIFSARSVQGLERIIASLNRQLRKNHQIQEAIKYMQTLLGSVSAEETQEIPQAAVSKRTAPSPIPSLRQELASMDDDEVRLLIANVYALQDNLPDAVSMLTENHNPSRLTMAVLRYYADVLEYHREDILPARERIYNELKRRGRTDVIDHYFGPDPKKPVQMLSMRVTEQFIQSVAWPSEKSAKVTRPESKILDEAKRDILALKADLINYPVNRSLKHGNATLAIQEMRSLRDEIVKHSLRKQVSGRLNGILAAWSIEDEDSIRDVLVAAQNDLDQEIHMFDFARIFDAIPTMRNIQRNGDKVQGLVTMLNAPGKIDNIFVTLEVDLSEAGTKRGITAREFVDGNLTLATNFFGNEAEAIERSVQSQIGKTGVQSKYEEVLAFIEQYKNDPRIPGFNPFAVLAAYGETLAEGTVTTIQLVEEYFGIVQDYAEISETDGAQYLRKDPVTLKKDSPNWDEHLIANALVTVKTFAQIAIKRQDVREDQDYKVKVVEEGKTVLLMNELNRRMQDPKTALEIQRLFTDFPQVKGFSRQEAMAQSMEERLKGAYKKVLIADDEEPNIGLFKRFFAKILGPDTVIITARDGEEALELFKKERPDLLFTDIRMPKKYGHELALEAAQIDPNISVIFASGDSVPFIEQNEAMIKKHIRIFATLHKPATMNAFMKALIAVLNLKEEQEETLPRAEGENRPEARRATDVSVVGTTLQTHSMMTRGMILDQGAGILELLLQNGDFTSTRGISTPEAKSKLRNAGSEMVMLNEAGFPQETIIDTAQDTEQIFSVPGVSFYLPERVNAKIGGRDAVLDRMTASRLWIASWLIRNVTAVAQEAGISNTELQKMIDSVLSSISAEVQIPASSALEGPQVQVYLSDLDPENIDELVKSFAVVLGSLVTLRARLIINLHADQTTTRKIEKDIKALAQAENITLAQGQIRFLDQNMASFIAKVKADQKIDALIAQNEDVLNRVPRSKNIRTRWLTDEEAKQNMKTLAAEIATVLYAALDERVSHFDIHRPSEYNSGILLKAVLNAIQGYLQIRVAA